MKTIKTILLVVAFTMTGFVNYANNTAINTVLDAEKITVEFNDAKKGHQLTIKDTDGVILHSEEVTKEGKLVKTFNFSELKNGNYTLELEKDFEIVIKSIKIENDTVVFNRDSKKVIFKPIIRNNENKLMITKIAFDAKPLQVSIFYNNEVIYSETIEGGAILNRVYCLDKELKGDYKVVSYNNGRMYVNKFKI